LLSLAGDNVGQLGEHGHALVRKAEPPTQTELEQVRQQVDQQLTALYRSREAVVDRIVDDRGNGRVGTLDGVRSAKNKKWK